MQELKLHGTNLPIALVRGYLLDPKVIEQLAAAAFRAPERTVVVGLVKSFREPPLSITRTINPDHVEVAWKKEGYADCFVQGYRTEEGIPHENASESDLGTRILNTKAQQGDLEDFIPQGKTLYYTFFIPRLEKTGLLAWRDEREVRLGHITFSVRLRSAQDLTDQLADLIHIAGKTDELLSMVKELKPEDERRSEKAHSAGERHKMYTHGLECARRELREKIERIRNDPSLTTDDEKEDEIQNAESDHSYFVHMLHEALIE